MTSGFFALLDDIAYLLDDVATITKIAAKKTAGILWDDLAVNAKNALGVAARRELPVIWRITKGSFINKLIIIPLVLLWDRFLPWVMERVLVAWWVYLAFEGVEKILEWIDHLIHHTKKTTKPVKKVSETQKIQGAIRLDFILSLEIIIVTFSMVADKDWLTKLLVLSIVWFLATVGVYWLVAMIIKMDDFGLWLMRFKSPVFKKIGYWFVLSMPYVIKLLSVIGVIAMILVGWWIWLHHSWLLHWVGTRHLPYLLQEFVIGLIVGTLAWILVETMHKFFLYHKNKSS